MSLTHTDLDHNNEIQSHIEAIVKAIQVSQSRINAIQPASSELKASYDDVVAKFQSNRGGNLLFPYLSSGLGHGPFVKLADGSVKYDFIIGIGVHIMGHSHPDVIRASLKGAIADTVMQGNLQQDIESAAFTETLLQAAKVNGSRLSHCFMSSTGVMAGENALKIAFQKKSPAKRVLCLNKCFMGRTLIMSNTTDNPAYREGLPKFIDVDYVPFFDSKNPEASKDLALKTLKKHLADHPGEHAAMCFELVIGEGGFYVGDADYYRSLMDVLKQHDIPILIDEVQSFARTSQLFAFQHFGLDQYVDAVWIGKASQVCATLFTEALKPKPGLLSQTYTASSTAIHAGHVIIKHLLNGGYYGSDGKMTRLQRYCETRLEGIRERHPNLLEGPYGVGAMVGFTPLGGNTDKVKKLVQNLFHAGVMTLNCGKEIARLRFLLPAPVVTEKHIDEVMNILERVLIQTDKETQV